MIPKTKQRKSGKAKPKKPAKKVAVRRNRTAQKKTGTNKLIQPQVIRSIIPLSGEPGRPYPVGQFKTEGGSEVFRFKIVDLVKSYTTDNNGRILPSTSGNKLTIGPSLFNAVNALKLLYDRVRLVGMTFHWMPATSLSQAGHLCAFIDYRNDTTVDTMAKAVRTQGAESFSPWERAAVIWHAQDPIDLQYINSASTGAFNTTQTATYQVYGEGMAEDTVVGYIHAAAVLEFTGRQTVA